MRKYIFVVLLTIGLGCTVSGQTNAQTKKNEDKTQKKVDKEQHQLNEHRERLNRIAKSV